MIKNCHGLLYHCFQSHWLQLLVPFFLKLFENMKLSTIETFGIILPFIAWGTRVHASIG